MGRFKFKSIFAFLFVLASVMVMFNNVKAIVGVDPDISNGGTWSQDSSGRAITGGTIYNSTMSIAEQTYRWAAFWGNITGSIELREGGSNSIYSWTITDIQDASVIYASTNSSTLDPGSLAAFNDTYLADADTAYGYVTTVTDSITNTFDGANTFQSPSMSTAINVNHTQMESTWDNYIMRVADIDVSATSDIVFAAEIKNDQPSFYPGHQADYELLVPENEENGDGEGSTTTYYFWLEFN